MSGVPKVPPAERSCREHRQSLRAPQRPQEEMATVTVDYELLRQPLQEKTLTGALAFRVVYDGSHRPVLFSIDKDGQLLLVAAGDTGEYTVVNISTQLKFLPSEKVTAMAVSQEKNLDIYIAFATGEEKIPSRLWVFPPLSPKSGNWYANISGYTSVETPNWVISKLLLVSSLT